MEKISIKGQSSRQPRGRLRKKRLFAWLAALFLISATIGYACLGGDSSSSSVLSLPLRIFGQKDKINILVLGVDEREDDVGRSDTAIVVSLDFKSKQAAMLSIPRDTRVKISGHGWDKINHAYAFGGSKLSEAAVEDFLGISLDYTVAINIAGFVKAVDALGGITVDVEKRMYYTDPYDDDGGLVIDLRPGVQHMNGHTAIQYVRYRDEEGDIGRVARQQKFMKAVLQECSKPQIIAKLPDLVTAFRSMVKTDMPLATMVQAAAMVKEASQNGLTAEMVPGTPAFIQDISYWLPDITKLRSLVAKMQNLTIDSQYAALTERLASEYARSIPAETKSRELGPLTPAAAVGKKPDDKKTDANKQKPDAAKAEDKKNKPEDKKAVEERNTNNSASTSGKNTAADKSTTSATNSQTAANAQTNRAQ